MFLTRMFKTSGKAAAATKKKQPNASPPIASFPLTQNNGSGNDPPPFTSDDASISAFINAEPGPELLAAANVMVQRMGGLPFADEKLPQIITTLESVGGSSRAATTLARVLKSKSPLDESCLLAVLDATALFLCAPDSLYFELGICGALTGMVKKYPEQVQIVSRVLMCVRYFAFGNEPARDEFMANGLCSLLMRIFETSLQAPSTPDKSNVVEQICGVIKNLSIPPETITVKLEAKKPNEGSVLPEYVIQSRAACDACRDFPLMHGYHFRQDIDLCLPCWLVLNSTVVSSEQVEAFKVNKQIQPTDYADFIVFGPVEVKKRFNRTLEERLADQTARQVQLVKLVGDQVVDLLESHKKNEDILMQALAAVANMVEGNRDTQTSLGKFDAVISVCKLVESYLHLNVEVAKVAIECLVALGWNHVDNSATMVRAGAGKVVVRVLEVFGEDTSKTDLLESTAQAFCMLTICGSTVENDVTDLLRYGGGKCLQILILRHFSKPEIMLYVMESVAQLAVSEAARYELVANQFDRLVLELMKKYSATTALVEPGMRAITNLAKSDKLARQLMQNVELPMLVLALLRLHIRNAEIIDSGATCIEQLAQDDLGVLAFTVMDAPKLLAEALVIHTADHEVKGNIEKALKAFIRVGGLMPGSGAAETLAAGAVAAARLGALNDLGSSARDEAGAFAALLAGGGGGSDMSLGEE